MNPSDARRHTSTARLPDLWTAWHALKIRDAHGYLGEGDFVLAHPQRGLLVIEVKGQVPLRTLQRRIDRGHLLPQRLNR